VQQRVAVVGPQLRRLGLGLRRSGAAASAFRLKKDCRHFTNERVAGVRLFASSWMEGLTLLTCTNVYLYVKCATSPTNTRISDGLEATLCFEIHRV